MNRSRLPAPSVPISRLSAPISRLTAWQRRSPGFESGAGPRHARLGPDIITLAINRGKRYLIVVLMTVHRVAAGFPAHYLNAAVAPATAIAKGPLLPFVRHICRLVRQPSALRRAIETPKCRGDSV